MVQIFEDSHISLADLTMERGDEDEVEEEKG
jgi:hypothetical protein